MSNGEYSMAVQIAEIQKRLDEGNRKFEKIDAHFDRIDIDGTRICSLNKAGAEQMTREITELKGELKNISNTIRNHIYIAFTGIGILYTILTLWK